MQPSILVTHQHEPVALVNARHTTLLGSTAELPPDSPRRRFVIYMAYHAQLIAQGRLPGPYRQNEAEAFAQEAMGE